MAGRRAAVDRYVGHEAGRADGRAEFKPISTAGDFQICELMPKLAKQGKHLSIVRSMSTREADHERGRYYMHTAYVPNPSVEHPSYGSVVAHEMEQQDCRSWRFRRSCRSAGRAKGRASWAWRTRRSRSMPTGRSATRR